MDVKMGFMAVCVMFAASGEAALKTSFDVGDYVQDGLLVNFDAIRNRGMDAAHDSSAQTWIDASGAGHTATLAVMKDVSGDGTGDAGKWHDGSYEFSGYSYWEMSAGVELGDDFSVQLVTDVDMSDFGDGKHTYNTIWGSSSFSVYLDRSYSGAISSSNLLWKTDEYKGDQTRPTCGSWDGRYITATLDAKRAFFFPGTDWTSVSNKWGMDRSVTEHTPVPSLKYAWGGRYASNRACTYCGKGRFHAWRAYGRKLSNAELRWNRGVDEIRFRGSTNLPATNVVVIAWDGDPFGVELPGPYLVDGEHVFSASNSVIGKCSYAVDGYFLEIWNVALGTWDDPVFHEGNTYRYVSTGLDSATVRLRWKWVLQDGIASFDVGDYVSDGLILHYDGIRNVGACLGNDDETATWVDLSGSGNNATLKKLGGGSVGAWAGDGYRFDGYSYFETSDRLDLGMEFTVQLAGDLNRNDFGDGIHDYHVYFYRKGGGIEVFMDRSYDAAKAGNVLYFKGDGYTGTGCRPQFTWEGNVFSCAFDPVGKTTAMTQTNRWIRGDELWGYTRGFTAEQTAVPESVYMIGGCNAGSPKNYCGHGKISAVRVYSRKLTDAELAVNYDIDGIRFYGRAPTHLANAVLVCSKGFAADESGICKLVGTGVFTAEDKRENGVTYSPRWTLETYDASTGEWLATDKGSSGSCRLSASEANAPRRLTWTWRRRGGFAFVVK